MHPKEHRNRLELVDFLRGVAILEMLAAHFSRFFPALIQQLVSYTETAMALFILLAGFMVGWHYPRFERNPRQQTFSLWRRALQVLAIQYIIILTVGVPLYLLGMPGIDSHESLALFVLRSMTLLNQIGLIHILPTFIPMFVVAPVILLALKKRLGLLVLLASVGIFLFGHYHPHALDLGQATIFPFILFQLYFVVGILLGRTGQARGNIVPRHPARYLAMSCVLLLATMLIVHGKIIPAGSMSIHPLNLFGLIYHAPLILTVCFFSMTFWSVIQRTWVYPYITRFGRHPLLAFVIHLYLAKLIDVLNFLVAIPMWANYGLILLSLVVMNAVLSAYEMSLPEPRPPLWVRGLRVLFK